MLTPEQIDAIVRHFERLFRERTPARSIDHVLCSSRVTFTELLALHPEMHATDREFLAPRIAAVMHRLRREFPGEVW